MPILRESICLSGIGSMAYGLTRSVMPCHACSNCMESHSQDIFLCRYIALIQIEGEKIEAYLFQGVRFALKMGDSHSWPHIPPAQPTGGCPPPCQCPQVRPYSLSNRSAEGVILILAKSRDSEGSLSCEDIPDYLDAAKVAQCSLCCAFSKGCAETLMLRG